MNRNGKRMKLKATRLTEAQRCEFIAKLSKPNVLSKRVLGWEDEVRDGAIWKITETMQMEEEPPIDDKIKPIETFVEFESATSFKGFKALPSLTSTTDCFASMFR